MAAINTRSLTLTIDGQDVTAQVSRAVIGSAATDSDFVTFANAAAGGGRDYTMGLTFVQDAAAATLWDQVFSNAGDTVAYVYRPYGNAVATALQPHFTGSLVITEPDGDLIGGEADASPSARWTTDVEWALTDKPTRATGA